jgi:hypothetical protein
LLQALIDGSTIQELVDLTRIDPWFLHEMKEIADTIHEISTFTLETLPKELLARSEALRFFRYTSGPDTACDARSDIGAAAEGRHQSDI